MSRDLVGARVGVAHRVRRTMSEFHVNSELVAEGPGQKMIRIVMKTNRRDVAVAVGLNRESRLPNSRGFRPGRRRFPTSRSSRPVRVAAVTAGAVADVVAEAGEAEDEVRHADRRLVDGCPNYSELSVSDFPETILIR